MKLINFGADEELTYQGELIMTLLSHELSLIRRSPGSINYQQFVAPNLRDLIYFFRDGRVMTTTKREPYSPGTLHEP